MAVPLVGDCHFLLNNPFLIRELFFLRIFVEEHISH